MRIAQWVRSPPSEHVHLSENYIGVIFVDTICAKWRVQSACRLKWGAASARVEHVASSAHAVKITKQDILNGAYMITFSLSLVQSWLCDIRMFFDVLHWRGILSRGCSKGRLQKTICVVGNFAVRGQSCDSEKTQAFPRRE